MSKTPWVIAGTVGGLAAAAGVGQAAVREAPLGGLDATNTSMVGMGASATLLVGGFFGALAVQPTHHPKNAPGKLPGLVILPGHPVTGVRPAIARGLGYTAAAGLGAYLVSTAGLGIFGVQKARG